MRSAVLAFVFLASPAIAQDLPRGLGHPNDGSHWYDRTCCDDRDCEQLEPGAITRTATGFVILYRSSRGHIARGFLRRGAPGIKASQDGKEHGCSYASGQAVCIYLPPET